MSIQRHKPEEVVSKLRQVDVLVGQDMSRMSLNPSLGILAQLTLH